MYEEKIEIEDFKNHSDQIWPVKVKKIIIINNVPKRPFAACTAIETYQKQSPLSLSLW